MRSGANAMKRAFLRRLWCKMPWGCEGWLIIYYGVGEVIRKREVFQKDFHLLKRTYKTKEALSLSS